MKSILIVEDEDTIAKNISISLKNLDYNNNNIYIANSGMQALKTIEEKHPDLVLVDIVLPGKINGIELAHIIKDRINIPVIFVTAYSDEDTVNKAKLTEPYGYITKPFQKKDLKIAIDIALHKFKIEKKLKENEAKLKTILHTMPSGLFTIDLNKKITTWNKEAETITGLKAKETIGKHCLETLFCDECKKGCLLFDDDVDKPIYHKESVLHINEREIALLKNEDILKDFDGNIIGGIVSFIDITERKQAENELRKEKRFTENIIATILNSLLVINKNLKIKSANHTFYETFQMKPEKVIGASITNILGNENRRLITELTRLFGTADMLENFELHYQSKKMGSPREVRKLISKGERIFNITARGIIIAAAEEEEELVVLHDITERKISEEKLKDAYTELENAQQELIQSQTLAALGEFSSGIAHEIRNPLANISALAQFSIKNYIIDKPIKKNLRAIIRSSEKANKIIKELLDFARPRKLVLKPGYIIDSINRACELTKAKRSNNQIRLYKRCSRRLPKIMIDEQRIRQVFLNIINNSIDAMNNGGILSITAYLKDEFIEVNISDTGKGIKKHNVGKIFNPFFTLKHEGIGLGLSVTHRIIQAHKGKIEVESVFNKGTKFIISLPIMNNK